MQQLKKQNVRELSQTDISTTGRDRCKPLWFGNHLIDAFANLLDEVPTQSLGSLLIPTFSFTDVTIKEGMVTYSPRHFVRQSASRLLRDSGRNRDLASLRAALLLHAQPIQAAVSAQWSHSGRPRATQQATTSPPQAMPEVPLRQLPWHSSSGTTITWIAISTLQFYRPPSTSSTCLPHFSRATMARKHDPPARNRSAR